jgi:glycolate oxidase FAD binding subunit
VPPAQGATVLVELAARISGMQYFLDWAGGLIWLSVPSAAIAQVPDAYGAVIRQILAAKGGHATLLRGSDELRRQVAVFSLGAPEALMRRVKQGFDPASILNIGHFSADW